MCHREITLIFMIFGGFLSFADPWKPPQGGQRAKHTMSRARFAWYSRHAICEARTALHTISNKFEQKSEPKKTAIFESIQTTFSLVTPLPTPRGDYYLTTLIGQSLSTSRGVAASVAHVHLTTTKETIYTRPPDNFPGKPLQCKAQGNLIR